MDWKKALLIFVGLSIAFVLLVSAAIGLVATAGVIAVAESGLVDTVVDNVVQVVEEGERVTIEVDVPRVTVTDLDSRRSQEIVPHLEQIVPRLDHRAERIVIEGRDQIDFWPGFFWAPFNFLARTFVTLLAVGMVALGVWLLVRGRRPVEKKVDGE